MRINLFARKNARLLDIREKITEREVRNTKIDTLLCEISLFFLVRKSSVTWRMPRTS